MISATTKNSKHFSTDNTTLMITQIMIDYNDSNHKGNNDNNNHMLKTQARWVMLKSETTRISHDNKQANQSCRSGGDEQTVVKSCRFFSLPAN